MHFALVPIVAQLSISKRNIIPSIILGIWLRVIYSGVLNSVFKNEGKLLVRVDKWFPSSKTCNYCGEINKGLELSDREWTFESCGCTIDRDYNASKNIRDEGLRLLALIA